MKFNILFIILITIILGSCRHTPGKVETDLRGMFPDGVYKVGIYEEVAYRDPRILELQKKMTDAVKRHAEWFAEYKKKNKQPLPYHPKLGLTSAEYRELSLLYSANKPELNLTGRETVRVIHKRNSLEFSSDGKLKFLNKVEINFKENTITMFDSELSFLEEEIKGDTNSIFRSNWSGYAWQLLEPANAEMILPQDYKKSDIKILKFTIGKMEKNDVPFFIVKGLIVKNGKKEFEFEAPVIF